MPRHYHSSFNQRQHMEMPDWELFYYEDRKFPNVTTHRHNYYEIYFFLGEQLTYQVGDKAYPMKYGDICLIPPNHDHRPRYADASLPCRRMVLWISQQYMEHLAQTYPDLLIGFSRCTQKKHYHLSTDFSMAQALFSKVIEIIEERDGASLYHEIIIECHLVSVLYLVNRFVARLDCGKTQVRCSQGLFSNLCEYIRSQPPENLTLDSVAGAFFVSKYHIAHVFKENMGIPLHQYLTQKRLSACKSSIMTGMPLQEVAARHGYQDYSVFFRAFKKAFGMTPKAYQSLHQIKKARK